MTDRVLIGQKNTLEGTEVIFSRLALGINSGTGFDKAYVEIPSGVLLSEIPSAGAIGVQVSGSLYDTLFYKSVVQVLEAWWVFTLDPPSSDQYSPQTNVKINTPVGGIWISKPTANVLAITSANIPEEDWYGFQEEFDWAATVDETWDVFSPGTNRSFIPDNYPDPAPGLSPFGFATHVYGTANPTDYQAQRGRVRRTVNNTLLYTGGYGDMVLHSPVFIDANTIQVAAGGHGYAREYDPWPGDIHPSAINTTDYPLVEMRIRRLSTPNRPAGGGNDLILYWSASPIDETPTPAGASSWANYLIGEGSTTWNNTAGRHPGDTLFFHERGGG